jgi:hypothetical protein
MVSKRINSVRFLEDMPDWKYGDIAVIREGWVFAGKHMKVLGSAIFCQQYWWVPVLDPNEEDPTFFEMAGLIKASDKVKSKIRRKYGTK